MTLQVFTANRLIDGVVVFLKKDGRWSESVFECSVITNDGELALMTRLAEAGMGGSTVVVPYVIDVTHEGGLLRPVSYRERIRAFGPSTHPEFAKQPAAAAA